MGMCRSTGYGCLPYRYLVSLFSAFDMVSLERLSTCVVITTFFKKIKFCDVRDWSKSIEGEGPEQRGGGS